MIDASSSLGRATTRPVALPAARPALPGAGSTACVDLEPGFDLGYLLPRRGRRQPPPSAIYQRSRPSRQDDRRERMRPILRPFDPIGSTGEVEFLTRKDVSSHE